MIVLGLINNVFNKYLDKFDVVLLDGILVYSKSDEEKKGHLKLVLKVLRENQVYAKLSKCDFYRKKIHYLGHIIYEEGIVVDPKYIKSIKKWCMPRNMV